VVATQSGRIKVFQGQEELATFNSHFGRAAGIALHPSGDILASVGDDKSYVLYDLDAMTTITQVYTDSGMPKTSPYLSDF
jgi:pre-mRNA-processing factor 19